MKTLDSENIELSQLMVNVEDLFCSQSFDMQRVYLLSNEGGQILEIQ